MLPALSKMRPADYAFIDGHHDEKATVQYFDQMYPHLSSRSMVVFDDIDWSPGMQRAWKEIEKNPRVSLAVDLGPVGVCVIDKASTAARRYHVHLGGVFAPQ
jgi:predicted O-methyltransferase YrrM